MLMSKIANGQQFTKDIFNFVKFLVNYIVN